MKYGLCLQPYIPMRLEPAESSEMVSQMLFGDTFTIDDEKPRWYHVVRDCDGYKGWIDWKTATLIDERAHKKYCLSAKDALLLRLPFNPVQRSYNGQSGSAHLSWGSRVYDMDDTGITFRMNGVRFDVPSMSYVQPMHAEGMSRNACAKYLLQQAQMLLNTPYLWGGTAAFGLDCSGFIQTLFRFIAITLPRDASQQVLMGEEVSFENLQAGDLAFFSTSEESHSISHVGLVSGDGRVLHVSGYLHFDELRPEGIWNIERKEMSHYLRALRRYF